MATTRPRERILDAATRLFADEGINATSVDRVIAEADVAPMTVYRQFGGKDGLVAATLERWSERWLAWLRDESWTDDEDAGRGSRASGPRSKVVRRRGLPRVVRGQRRHRAPPSRDTPAQAAIATTGPPFASCCATSQARPACPRPRAPPSSSTS